jgi:hypothetical protein
MELALLLKADAGRDHRGSRQYHQQGAAELGLQFSHPTPLPLLKHFPHRAKRTQAQPLLPLCPCTKIHRSLRPVICTLHATAVQLDLVPFARVFQSLSAIPPDGASQFGISHF